MGWGSASGSIFNPVMRELQKAHVHPDTRKRVAKVLIKALQEADWDTLDESLEEFKDDPPIVAAFREEASWMFEADWPDEDFEPEYNSYPWKYTA